MSEHHINTSQHAPPVGCWWHNSGGCLVSLLYVKHALQTLRVGARVWFGDISVSRTISCFTQGTQVWCVLPPTTAYFVWQWHGWFLRKGWRLVINRWKKKDFNKAAAVRRAGNQEVSNRANEMSFSHTFTMWGRCFTAHWLNSIGVHTKRKDKLAF